MYVPAHFKPDDGTVRELLRNLGAANLITATADGLLATMLPLVYDEGESRPGLGPWGALLGHVARNNGQWRVPAIGEALVIVQGPDAYISPAWYATKREHGRVVPTWNYVTAHVHGRLVIHDDPEWVEANVRRLTAKYEATRAEPWSVRRRARDVHRRPAQGDRRRRDRHRPGRRQSQAQPEPLGRRRRGRDRGSRGARGAPGLGGDAGPGTDAGGRRLTLSR